LAPHEQRIGEGIRPRKCNFDDRERWRTKGGAIFIMTMDSDESMKLTMDERIWRLPVRIFCFDAVIKLALGAKYRPLPMRNCDSCGQN
jgi:uncharacterized protein (DUF2126 family)